MCNALYLWMLEPHERDAVLANDAIERRVTDYKALIEIYTRQKLSQLFFTKHAYLAKFKRHMDQDMISEPSNSYQKVGFLQISGFLTPGCVTKINVGSMVSCQLLLALAASQKSHHTDVSQHIAKCDAKRLYEAGHCSTGGTDESLVLEIFSKRGIPQLRLALFSYKQIYGHDYTKVSSHRGLVLLCAPWILRRSFDQFNLIYRHWRKTQAESLRKHWGLP